MTTPDTIPPVPDFGFPPGPWVAEKLQSHNVVIIDIRTATGAHLGSVYVEDARGPAEETAALVLASPALFHAGRRALEHILIATFDGVRATATIDALYANRFTAWPDDRPYPIAAEGLRRALAEALATGAVE